MSDIPTLHHYIDGKTATGNSERRGDIINPATGETIRQVALASRADVEAAIASAENALPGWSETPPGKRAQVLFNFRELIRANMDDLAERVSSEHGKTLEDAKGSITRGLEVVEFACGISQLLKSEFTENVAGGVDSWGVRQPLGVCAGITPFNFPAMVPMWMFPVAIACGNTFVLK
ncbi:MAG: aldehyde dehydrogenase family protein, partial [Gammaproteobacteria bacterium]|nr:aldehyde dehydrogenase family protein [Gammaproteobacteria bacterium]